MVNSKAWVSVVGCEEKHFKGKRIPFKVLFLLDNNPSNLQNIIDFDPNVTVVYLPLNTTTLLQLTDQGITAIFKRYYMEVTL